MKIPLLPVIALALLGTLAAVVPLRAAADDTTRRAQQALRDGGFYYGPIDGTPGEETTQATRRYQIRNGLAVSGQFNTETLRSLGINAPPPPSAPAGGASSSPAGGRSPRSEPTPPPLSTPTPANTVPRTITSRPAAPTPPPPSPPRRVSPSQGFEPPAARPPEPPRGSALPPGAQVPSVPLTGFFSRTPYEFAPPAVQADVLRRAQRSLGRGGFYEGAADGQPGRRTVEAIGEFQGAFRLPRSGRLDSPTLRLLRLLPDRGSNVPEPIPARRRGAPEPEPDLEDEEEDYAPGVRVRPRRPGPEVYEGRILR